MEEDTWLDLRWLYTYKIESWQAPKLHLGNMDC